MKHYLSEGGKKQGNDNTKKNKHRRLSESLVIFIALTNTVTGALVTIRTGRAVTNV